MSYSFENSTKTELTIYLSLHPYFLYYVSIDVLSLSCPKNIIECDVKLTNRWVRQDVEKQSLEYIPAARRTSFCEKWCSK
jgi:hypothetical protein